MKKILLFFAVLLFSKLTFGQCSEEVLNNLKKTAIVFGEKDYQFADTLKNPRNDAEDISRALKRLNFEVITLTNTDLRTMKSAIDDWSAKLSNYDVALFYYSGHGAEVSGENYIFPIDANPITPSDLNWVAYPINKILGRMDFAKVKTNIIILDACRTNPFVRKWRTRDFTPSSGLAPITSEGAFIGFAASPGFIAYDGKGRNGTYTEAILKNIEIPNLSLDQIFTKVNADVRKMSLEKQIPFKNSSLSMDFCFKLETQKISETNELNKKFAYNIKSLLHKVEFNSTLQDVLAFEFGSPINTITYESLPAAIECSSQHIKYYWRYLKESKFKPEIYSFLYSKGLNDKISNDSYIVYYFEENKLVRVTLRAFPLTYNAMPQLLDALGQNINSYPEKYQAKLYDFYFTTGSSYNDITSTEISISNEAGYKMCIHDWWHK